MHDTTQPQVNTRVGRFEGVARRGVDCFLGIRYARAARFEAPVPQAPSDARRAADKPGPIAPQPAGEADALIGGASPQQSEDCLSLNVFRPSRPAGRRPVMVFVHGGAFTSGAGASEGYQPLRLVAQGDVVVVTLNYRVGPLGSLHTRSLGLSADARNLGLLDQRCALQWVQAHITDFGGDPDCVTLFGESAGATSVAALIASEGSRGLLRRAIAQSCGVRQLLSEAQSVRAAELFAEQLASLGHDSSRLQQLPHAALVEAVAGTMSRSAREGVRLAFAPTVGAALVPTEPLQAVAQGRAAGIDLIVGHNRDEWRLFAPGEGGLSKLTEAGLAAKLARRMFRGHPDAEARARRLLAAYQPGEDAYDLFCAIEGDRVYRMPGLALAEAQLPHGDSVHVYMLTWCSPIDLLRCCHGIDLPFVFGTLDVPRWQQMAGSGPEAEALSTAMISAWSTFARNGQPQAAGMAAWPRYDLARRPTMVLGRRCELQEDPLGQRRRAWEDSPGP